MISIKKLFIISLFFSKITFTDTSEQQKIATEEQIFTLEQQITNLEQEYLNILDSDLNKKESLKNYQF
jgi:hypothetical protein